MVIGLGSRKMVGKSTAAEYLRCHYGFENINFADALRDECKIIWRNLLLEWGLERYGPLELADQDAENTFIDSLFLEDKPTFIRRLLQCHGTELRRAEDPAYWIRRWEKRVKYVTFPHNVVVADVRFINEANHIKRNRKGKLIKIIRRVKFPSAELPDHHLSEVELDHFPDWDAIIDNNGTIEDLYRKLDALMNEWQISCREESAT